MPNSSIVNVNVTFRNTDATDALRTYGVEKMTGVLKKYLHKNTEADLVLKVEKNRQLAEVTFNSEGVTFTAREMTDDMYKSIDGLVDTIGAQLRKHKERVTSHT